MVKESIQPESLEALAERITRCASAIDDRILEAAELICVARERFEKELAGQTTWTRWAREHIQLSESRRRDLQRIADAEDPRQELERQRNLTRKGVENHRQKKKAGQVVPLRSAGDKTVKAPANHEDDRPNPSEIGPEHNGIDPKDRTDEPPLRNGGGAAATEVATDEQEHRDRLVKWAKSAQIEQVRHVLSYIESREQAKSGSAPGDLAAPEAA